MQEQVYKTEAAGVELSIPEIKKDKKRGVAPWLVQI